MNVSFMQSASGNFRIRIHTNDYNASSPNSFDYQIDLTTAQWKAILDIVGVAASVAAGTAGSVAYSPEGKRAGALAPNDLTS